MKGFEYEKLVGLSGVLLKEIFQSLVAALLLNTITKLDNGQSNLIESFYSQSFSFSFPALHQEGFADVRLYLLS